MIGTCEQKVKEDHLAMQATCYLSLSNHVTLGRSSELTEVTRPQPWLGCGPVVTASVASSIAVSFKLCVQHAARRCCQLPRHLRPPSASLLLGQVYAAPADPAGGQRHQELL